MNYYIEILRFPQSNQILHSLLFIESYQSPKFHLENPQPTFRRTHRNFIIQTIKKFNHFLEFDPLNFKPSKLIHFNCCFQFLEFLLNLVHLLSLHFFLQFSYFKNFEFYQNILILIIQISIAESVPSFLSYFINLKSALQFKFYHLHLCII